MGEGKGEGVFSFTHLLLSAWCQDDFALLESVIGNRDNPLAALALEFKIVSANFCDELAAFTSRFGRLELFSQPLGVSIEIH